MKKPPVLRFSRPQAACDQLWLLSREREGRTVGSSRE